MKYFIVAFLFIFYTTSFADHHENNKLTEETPIVTELPTNYGEFVEIIGILTVDEIIKILGEPVKKIELKMKSSNDVIARTWYYHNINTDESGRYFPTTELDIVDGYVESVVFMNEVDETTTIEAKKYDIDRPDGVF
tara:strand:- start:308 stop:718 length:411 start_codon:yes stop_codon:yes gene_type:complete